MMHGLVIFFPFMVCLFWTAVFVLEWRKANPAKHMLALFMAVCSALYFCHAVFFGGLGEPSPVADCVYAFCNIAVFPLYLLYVLRLTGSGSLGWRCVLLLAPAVLVGVFACATVYYPPLSETKVILAKTVFLIQLAPICFVAVRRLRDFDRRVENFFSDTEYRAVTHTRQIVAVLCVVGCCSAVAGFLGREHFLERSSLLFFPSLIFGSLLFMVGYVGQKQVFCATDLPSDSEADRESDESAQASSRVLSDLEALMRDDSIFLQPDLRLSDVAALLHVSRSTLSSAINRGLGVSFSDYVNSWRVRHAQQIMLDHPAAARQSVIQIAEQCGFSSESSFYRAFRKSVGLTPKQWIERAIR